MKRTPRPFRLMPGYDVYEVRRASIGDHPHTLRESGCVYERTVERATRCRCCGASMPKGTTALVINYDIYDNGSPDPIRGLWMSCYLHKEACRDVRSIDAYSYSALA